MRRTANARTSAGRGLDRLGVVSQDTDAVDRQADVLLGPKLP
jgi:hypothetical protein